MLELALLYLDQDKHEIYPMGCIHTLLRFVAVHFVILCITVPFVVVLTKL